MLFHVYKTTTPVAIIQFCTVLHTTTVEDKDVTLAAAQLMHSHQSFLGTTVF